MRDKNTANLCEFTINYLGTGISYHRCETGISLNMGGGRMVGGFTTTINSNPVCGEVYSVQHDVVHFFPNLQQAGGFLRFTPPIQLTTTE